MCLWWTWYSFLNLLLQSSVPDARSSGTSWSTGELGHCVLVGVAFRVEVVLLGDVGLVEVALHAEVEVALDNVALLAWSS